MATSPGPCRTGKVSSQSRLLSSHLCSRRQEGGEYCVNRLEDSRHQRTATHCQGSGSDPVYSRQGLVATSSLQVFAVPLNTPHPAHSHGAGPTDCTYTYKYYKTRGPGLERYPPQTVWGTGLHFPMACLTKPSDCWTPHSPSSPLVGLGRAELPLPAKEEKGQEPKVSPSVSLPVL